MYGPLLYAGTTVYCLLISSFSLCLSQSTPVDDSLNVDRLGISSVSLTFGAEYLLTDSVCIGIL